MPFLATPPPCSGSRRETVTRQPRVPRSRSAASESPGLRLPSHSGYAGEWSFLGRRCSPGAGRGRLMPTGPSGPCPAVRAPLPRPADFPVVHRLPNLLGLRRKKDSARLPSRPSLPRPLAAAPLAAVCLSPGHEPLFQQTGLPKYPLLPLPGHSAVHCTAEQPSLRTPAGEIPASVSFRVAGPVSRGPGPWSRTMHCSKTMHTNRWCPLSRAT